MFKSNEKTDYKDKYKKAEGHIPNEAERNTMFSWLDDTLHILILIQTTNDIIPPLDNVSSKRCLRTGLGLNQIPPQEKNRFGAPICSVLFF